MTQMESEKKMRETKKLIEAGFAKKYQSIELNGKKYFFAGNGERVSIACVPLEITNPFFVVEYADGDDGDRFYPSDYENIDEMIADMMVEVEESGEG